MQRPFIMARFSIRRRVTATTPVDDAGFVRDFIGITSQPEVGVGEFALFGRVEMTADGTIAVPTQLAMALQRSSGLDFQLEDSSVQRTDFMSFQTTVVSAADQGMQGVLFDDANGNGVQDADESGIAARQIQLFITGGGEVTLNLGVEPDVLGAAPT